MLERALTTQRCSEIIRLLVSERGWTIPRIARVVRASTDYVRRIRLRKQSFQLADVELLAKACGQQPRMLIFDSIWRDKLSASEQSVYDLTLKEIERHDEFSRAMRPKATKRRRTGTRAA